MLLKAPLTCLLREENIEPRDFGKAGAPATFATFTVSTPSMLRKFVSFSGTAALAAAKLFVIVFASHGRCVSEAGGGGGGRGSGEFWVGLSFPGDVLFRSFWH